MTDHARPTPVPIARMGVGAVARAVDRSLVATMAVRVLIVAGGFVSSVITARWLSPDGRGEYFLVITLALTVAQFGNLGLQSSNTYLVARHRQLAGALLANSLWVSIGAGVIGAGVVGSLTGFSAAGVSQLILVAVLAAATLFYMLATNIVIGLGQTRRFNLFQLAANFGVLACLLGAAAFGAGPSGFVAASALSWAAVSIILLRTLRRETGARLRGDLRVFGEGFRYAVKAYAATLCGFLVLRINVFLLNAFAGADQVGYYSVASQIADVMAIVPQSMALLLFPALVAAERGRAAATTRHLAAVAVLLGAGCIAAWWLTAPLVRLAFGTAFLGAVPLLHWMLPGVFFLGLTSVTSQYLAASGFPASLVVVWIAGAGASLGLGWLLIPNGSAVGAAVAFSLSQTLIFGAVCGLSLAVARSRNREFISDHLVVTEGAVS